MATFTFADFLIFTGANVNEDSYVTIAKGVLNYVKVHYGIYPELEIVTETAFLTTNQVSYVPKVFPIIDINSITYDGTAIANTTYSYYGEDILFDVALTDVRIPIVISYDVGFTTVPDDLILAIYRHMSSVYQAIDKNTDNVSKTVNSAGNTTFFVNDVVPLASKQTYEFYAGHTLVRN